MKKVETLIIGGGPAGLCAALSAAEMGCQVLLVERDGALGGQLVKQTHMFFGSEKQYASTRGIDIGKLLLEKIDQSPNIEVWKNTTVVGLYEDRIVTLEKEGTYLKVDPDAIIVATGASEKSIPFPNNDLPGIYGAGAVQTLMNVYGVKPGDNVLMIGAGNIGLIVSYQLMQSGINVKAIVEGGPKIGGYLVHASKIRRLGIPIYTRYTVKEARGKNALESATIWQLDENWSPIPGTEIDLDVDVMCIAVGLSPLSELLWQAGCEMKYLAALGGYVPIRNSEMMTSIEGLFIAGDVAGIEEASSAMVEGYLAGLSAAAYTGRQSDRLDALKSDYIDQLSALRAGPEGARIRQGISEVSTA
ncbi:NAD(P)/FAD-dependent oxidoreductase [Acidaminobacter sp.]|uniref:NAD(P)/FAD-dependent oxidoreductase n=1 Tax=Acidaminobacter sp. TaxID=1872102 RepID=UPI00137F379E|nr:FAD-dependent oxidoreductase [Acidaminobacter sp.]MDK9710008.1 FAD-dependent oxidoreductase [Acidaminobacter sp.]MZQ98101.1 FAD-dependent oxidoreductase [Acidaminobacter sp.]